VASDSHIHGPASASANAGVLVGLSPFNGGAFGASGTMSGTTTLSASTLSSLIDGLTYINLHTSANPGGEIRGQILRSATAPADKRKPASPHPGDARSAAKRPLDVLLG
jgi:hypothetical protein